MAATFTFKVMTPNRRALDAEIVSLVAPGEGGYLGVLAHHAPLITTLQPGDLRVKYPDNREVHWRIGKGILKVAGNEAILLTESIEESS